MAIVHGLRLYLDVQITIGDGVGHLSDMLDIRNHLLK